MRFGDANNSRSVRFLKYLCYYPERFLVSILFLAIFFAILTPSIIYSSYSLTDADIMYDASEECSFTSSVTSAHTKTINPGTTQSGIGTTKITTKCVNSSDHQVYTIGYSNDTDGNTNLINSTSNATIATGTTTSGNVSNWAMLIAKDSSSYLPANLSIVNSFGSYHAVPSSATQISSYSGGTDSTTGSSITTTYRAKISDNQTAGSYVGKVKYTLTATMVYSVKIKTVTGISKVTLNGVECTSTSGCVVNNLTEGESYTLVATLATGYNFASWNAGANGSVASATSASTTYTVGGGDSEITPTTTPKTYKITLNGNGATTAGSASTTATYSSSTLTAITRPQRKYTISGFTLPDSNNASSATVSSTSTLTSTYTFNGWYKESSATNKIASNAATPVLLASTSYTNGNAEWTYDGARTLYAGWSSQAKTLPTITKTGYTCGWTETATNATSVTYQSGGTLTPAKNYTLYGVCEPIDYTITVTAGSGVSTISLDGWNGSGTNTLTKTYHIGDTIDLSAFTPEHKLAYSGVKYIKNDSIGSLTDEIYTVGAGNGNISISATALAMPICTVSGGSGSKVYNYSSTTITATSNSANYDMNSVNITYSFGYGSSASNTLGNFSSAQSGNSTVIAKNAYKGSRYYGVKVVVTDKNDNTITSTCTSGTGTGTGSTVAARTTITLVNSIIRFDATTNGGTLEGTSPLYVSYLGTDTYTSRTNSTTGTIPTAIPPTGYTFDGWYTESAAGSKVLNADNSFTGVAVSGWTNASSQWVKTSPNTSNETINILYAHYAPITYTITLNGNGATTAGSTSATVAYGATTLSAITKPFRSYTISGFTTTNNNASGATVSSTSTLTSSYTFKGWYEESSATNLIASNDTTPVLEPDTSYTDELGQWASASGHTLYAGWTSQQKTLPTITKPGYTCGWTETSSGATSITYASGAKLTPGRNYTLYGVCTKNKYTVTVNAGVGINTLTLNGWTNSGTGTLTKSYDYGDTIDLSAFVPDYLLGHNGKAYVKNDSYGSISGSTYTVGAGNGNITIKASALDTPTCTMQGGTTKVYNRSATTLTATDTSSLYEANSVNITYSFGYATSTSGTLGNFGTAQAGNTLSIAKALFYGTRYYGVTVNVTSVDDSSLTATCTSGTGSSTGTTVANRTTMALINSRVQLNANGGTISGTAYFYVAYGKANKYSSRTATTTYTLPTVTPPSGYAFDGWYTAAEGGSKVMNADFSLTGTAVSGWSNASSVWVKTGTSDSATATANLLYAHYTQTSYTITLNGNGATTAGSTSTTATYGSSNLGSITVPQRKYTISGFTTTNNNASGATVSSTSTLTSTYTFNGWYKESGATNKIASNAAIPALQASTSYTNASAQWTYDGAVTLYAGWSSQAKTLPTITKTGYTCGWTETSSGATSITYASGSSITPNKNYTLYGVCTAKTYTITLNGNGATTAGSTSTTATYGSSNLGSITVPQRKYTISGFTTTNNNASGATVSSTSTLTSTYTFNGWYKESGATNKIASNAATPALQANTSYTNASSQWTSTSNQTLYAGWSSKAVTLPTITKNGYTCGWTTTSSGATSITYNSGASFTPTANTTLYGVCIANKIYMQDVTASVCQNIANGSSATVYDKRDEQKYTIRFLNNKCWMTQNLRITGTVSGSSSLSNFSGSNFNVCAGDVTSGNSVTQARCHTETDTTEGRRVWYNYAAATAGTIATTSNTNTATSDICPAKWRLPSADEFRGLANTVSGYDFNYVTWGYYTGGGFYGSGQYAYWWSSTPATLQSGSPSPYSRHFLISNSGSLSVNTIYFDFGQDARGDGYFIRCLLK